MEKISQLILKGSSADLLNPSPQERGDNQNQWKQQNKMNLKQPFLPQKIQAQNQECLKIPWEISTQE